MSLLGKVGKVLDTSFPGIGSIIDPDSYSGRQQQEDANRMAMQAWTLANDYNHPSQQMARLKAAGLNPLLVYGSGSVTGNTTGAPSLTGGGISTTAESSFKGLSNIMSVIQGQANIQNTRAQTQASVASAGASGAQAANLNQQTAINQQRANFEERNLIADLDYKRALAQKTRQEARSAKANATMDEAEARIFGDVGNSGTVKNAVGVGASGIKVLRSLRGIFK